MLRAEGSEEAEPGCRWLGVRERTVHGEPQNVVKEAGRGGAGSVGRTVEPAWGTPEGARVETCGSGSDPGSAITVPPTGQN